VCPTSLTYNWLAEVDKFFTGFKAVVVDGSQQQRDSILKNVESYDLIIVNYEKLKGCMNLLKDKQFFYTVLDEAHKIKNSKSVIAQTVK
jgi:SNF2 family DNA or RNA helicase